MIWENQVFWLLERKGCEKLEPEKKVSPWNWPKLWGEVIEHKRFEGFLPWWAQEERWISVFHAALYSWERDIYVSEFFSSSGRGAVDLDFEANVKDFFTIRTDELPREGGTRTDFFKHWMKAIFIPAIGANLQDLFDFYCCHFFFHFGPPRIILLLIFYM